MALTKRQINELETIDDQLSRAEKFLMRENIKICVAGKMGSADVFRNDNPEFNPKGETLTPITKECGSELCLLRQSILDLRNFIDRNMK